MNLRWDSFEKKNKKNSNFFKLGKLGTEKGVLLGVTLSNENDFVEIKKISRVKVEKLI